jgi:murein DD-endopeptidase MepM/ murein hydrolase activator NlpD
MSNKFPDSKDAPRMTGERPVVFAGPTQKPPKKSAPRWIGLLMIMASLGFTLGTVVLLLTNQGDDPQTSLPTQTVSAVITANPTEPIEESTATVEIVAEETPVISTTITENLLPTIAPDQIQTLLSNTQPDQIEGVPLGMLKIDPFTISPARARSSMIQHTVSENETIDMIASRYNINTSSIAWSNSREIMQRFLRPGDVLNIPPVDGVYIQTTGSLRSFRDYAEDYGVDDPFTIVDSPYNPHLRDYNPDDVPPDGTQIFIAGGTSFDVVWPVAVEIVEETTSSGNWSGGTGRGTQGEDSVLRVTFQNGQPGSCAAQVAEGASQWVNPLGGNYRIVRGFSPGYHDGIDLATSQGTPIRAANGGRVVFAGWNTFGYGYMVALAHGPTMTVYAHMMEGGVAVSCGQLVGAGGIIGYVGSTGNSSGPHLHFEVLSRSGNNFIRVNPTSVMGF